MTGPFVWWQIVFRGFREVREWLSIGLMKLLYASTTWRTNRNLNDCHSFCSVKMLSKFIAKSEILLKGQDKLLILLKRFWKAVHGILCILMQIDCCITLKMSKSLLDDTVNDLKKCPKDAFTENMVFKTSLSI